MSTKRTNRAAPAVEPGALIVRNTPELRAARAVPRLRALAAAAGASGAQIARGVIMLGLERAEQDPAALARAFAK